MCYEDSELMWLSNDLLGYDRLRNWLETKVTIYLQMG